MSPNDESIWDTFWTIAAAISGLGLPGAILLLLVCYFVVFLRWICRDSSFADAWRATKPGRRLWLKISLGAAIALFLLNLPLCSLELLRYGFLVASAICVISIFSPGLRDAYRFSGWPFWLLSFALSLCFSLAVWAYCLSSREAAGLESFFPFVQLLLVGVGVFVFLRLPEAHKESAPGIAARVAFCAGTLLVMEHATMQMSYFLSYRSHDPQKAELLRAEAPWNPVSPAMLELLRNSPPRAPLPPAEEKLMRKRVEFEEDLSRVIAFFIGLAGFNSIFAIVSRRFGLRDAKTIPALGTLEHPGGLSAVPDVPEPVRRSVFFPNRAYRRGHRGMLFFFAFAGNLFVSSVTTFSTAKGDLWHFTLVFLAYSGLLFPPVALGCRNGFRLAAYRARSSLHGLRILMHNPKYVPIEVRVRRPTILQRIQHRITGAWIRHAEDGEGKIYSLMFAHCPGGEFPALLYRLRSGPLNESLTGRQAFVAIPKAETQAASPPAGTSSCA